MTNIEPIHSKDGKIYWVDSGDTLYIQRLKAGQYQSSNWKFAQTLIDDWTRCLDVGSNNACNAINYAELFDIVECFEPTGLAQQLWENTVKDNAVINCNLYKTAVGEINKTTEILIHKHNGGHNHLTHYDKNPRSQPQRRTRLLETIQCTTIDSYNFQNVGFIKIDVEGYEKFVLEGAEKTILSNRPTIQLEIVANQCRRFNYSAEDMINWIRSWDYTVISRHRGPLTGQFKSDKKRLLYNGQYYKGEMDLWFQPNERMRVYTFNNLFEEV
jgi:FkbM family methyltransferase